jgi:hypothetical protein
MADMIPMGKLLEAAQKEYPNLDKEELTALIGLQIEARQQQLKNEMKKIKMNRGGSSKVKDKDIEKAALPKSKPDVVNKDIMDMVDFKRYEKEKGELHPEDPRAGDNMDTGKAFYEEGDKTLKGEIERLTKLAKERKKFLGKKIDAAKGGSMPNQMEMFEEGGLKDEGGSVDPVSGNDVPIGSTKEEVRDDIPAQLSEGEFVFPADVVRYIGLQNLMQMRQQAKMGLKEMEAMGQMGNSEEATMPDDLPFDINDIDIEENEEYNNEDMEMAQGGVVYAANGFAGQAPKGGYSYKTPTVPKVDRKLKFKDLIGVDSGEAAAADEYKTYINEAGAEIQVPFRDGKILTGYNIPEGYMLKTEKADKPISQSKTVQSTRVQGTDDGGDDTGVADLGGARTTIGGVEYAVQYNFDGTVGLASVQDYKTTGKADFNKVSPALAEQIKTQAVGQVAEIAKAVGMKTAIVGEVAKKFGVELPGLKKLDTAITKAKTVQKDFDRGFKPEEMFDMGRSYLDDKDKGFADRSKEDKLGFEGLGEKDMRSIQGGLQFGKGDQINKGLDDGFVDSLGDIDKGISEDAFTSTAPDTSDVVGTTQPGDQFQSTSDNSSYDSSQDDSYSDSGYSDSIDTGGFNIGGLAGKKKKIKVKKMKRGGLASR